MDPRGFLADVEQTPDTLGRLADALDRGDVLGAVPPFPSAGARVLLLGMGSSTYAASVAAARLRAGGLDAVAELASSDLLPPAEPGTLVLGVSAGGESVETVAAVSRYVGRSQVLAVTERAGGAVSAGVLGVVPLLAGPEPGGVSCRSFRHTLAVLLALGDRLRPGIAPDVAGLCRRAAGATADLLDRRTSWLPDVSEALDGPAGSWVVAPARRLSSAQQSALMLREGPRRAAHACETGDWSHVDVYLTKTLDYRMLLLPGSAWDPALLAWTTERDATVVAVGADVPSATLSVRYAGDDEDDVRLLAETTVAELVAHRWWT
jgi:fructoselysine-6-P-deglycase FrlB-like protein